LTRNRYLGLLTRLHVLAFVMLTCVCG